MCDINKKTKLKTVDIYKICWKRGDKYYAYFSGMEISVGNVIDFVSTCDERFLNRINHIYTDIHNVNMIGRTSGFKLKRDAQYLLEYINKRTPLRNHRVLLKIKIGGDIMQGTGKKIIKDVRLDNDSVITYAGTEILEIQEVNC